VLPILHLNGYKISNPTVLARIESMRNWTSSYGACGWTPYFVEGDDPEKMHELMAPSWTRQSRHPANPKQCTEQEGHNSARWPNDRSEVAQGLTGPKVVDGLQVEGQPSERTKCRCWWMSEHPDHVKQLERLDEELLRPRAVL